MQNGNAIYTASGPLYAVGAYWQVEIDYRVFEAPEIEQVHIIGAYVKGDDVKRQDYTSLNTSVEIDPSELPDVAFERLQAIIDADWDETNLDADY